MTAPFAIRFRYVNPAHAGGRLRGNDGLKLVLFRSKTLTLLTTGEMHLQILHDFILVNLGTDSSHRIGKTPDDF